MGNDIATRLDAAACQSIPLHTTTEKTKKRVARHLPVQRLTVAFFKPQNHVDGIVSLERRYITPSIVCRRQMWLRELFDGIKGSEIPPRQQCSGPGLTS
jgi:hypothetical protein